MLALDRFKAQAEGKCTRARVVWVFFAGGGTAVKEKFEISFEA